HQKKKKSLQAECSPSPHLRERQPDAMASDAKNQSQKERQREMSEGIWHIRVGHSALHDGGLSVQRHRQSDSHPLLSVPLFSVWLDLHSLLLCGGVCLLEVLRLLPLVLLLLL